MVQKIFFFKVIFLIFCLNNNILIIKNIIGKTSSIYKETINNNSKKIRLHRIDIQEIKINYILKKMVV